MRKPTAGRATARRTGGSAGRRGPAHAARIPFALLVTGLIVGGLVLLLLLNTASAANEVRNHDLSQADANVAADVQQLQNQVAASAAPQNLAAAAAQLGMVPAANPAFLVVGKDGTVTVRGSAAPVSAAPIAAAVPKKKKPKATKTPKPLSGKAKARAAKAKAAKAKAAKAAKAKAAKAAKTTSTTTRAHPGPSRTATRGAKKPARPTAKPTPTPTPTISLPGGNR